MRPPYLSSGALSGVGQIVRGIVATPEAMLAPRQGKWWNELERKWTKTVLPDDFKEYVEGKPEDDSDLLGDIQEEVEASAMLSTEEVKETYYYDILEVGPQAEPSVIKRRYYVLARKYHPDKVDKDDKDDKESGDKFKDIAEAYQVLSDPDLRKNMMRTVVMVCLLTRLPSLTTCPRLIHLFYLHSCLVQINSLVILAVWRLPRPPWWVIRPKLPSRQLVSFSTVV